MSETDAWAASMIDLELLEQVTYELVKARISAGTIGGLHEEITTIIELARMCGDEVPFVPGFDVAQPTKRKPISAAKALRIFRRDGFTCQWCGDAGGDLTIDHIVPLAQGGDNDDPNLQTLCRSCNSSKGDR